MKIVGQIWHSCPRRRDRLRLRNKYKLCINNNILLNICNVTYRIERPDSCYQIKATRPPKVPTPHLLPIIVYMAAANLSALVSPSDLKGIRALDLCVHEKWLFGECRGQAECLYSQVGERNWVVVAPNLHDVCWVLSGADSEAAHVTATEADTHYRVRDIGDECRLNAQYIYNVTQKKLGDRIEICIEFANGTDITLHYNLITHESSLYFIKG